jgi:uncharacterized protein with PQ loop repeat
MKVKLLELTGWIGSIAFALSAAPQALKSIQDGHSNGIAGGMLALWFVGEIASLIYIWPKRHIPLITNYILNFIFISIILWFK